MLDTPGFAENLLQAGRTGRRAVRPGVAARVRAGRGELASRTRRSVTEINDRAIAVVGLFEIGPSFGIDGTIITSDDNWLRLFPERSRNEIELGLVTLEPGVDPGRRARPAALVRARRTCW